VTRVELWLVASLVRHRIGHGENSRYRELRGRRRAKSREQLTFAIFFFQTLTWVASALIAIAAPWGWLALSAPAPILFLVLLVTGVPPAEESSLRSRGEAYRRYQRETSVFLPWLPKRSSTA
jgi:steroid 5-alpha reductase family enzyme